MGKVSAEAELQAEPAEITESPRIRGKVVTHETTNYTAYLAMAKARASSLNNLAVKEMDCTLEMLFQYLSDTYQETLVLRGHPPINQNKDLPHLSLSVKSFF